MKLLNTTHFLFAMPEYYLSGGLIPEKEWVLIMESLESDKKLKNPHKEIKKSLVKAVLERAEEGCGVLFSGGVDSAVIAKILKNKGYDFTCYALGTRGSRDLKSAKRAAKKHGFKLQTKLLRGREIEDTIPEVIQILGTHNVIKVSVGFVVLEGLRFAKKDGCSVVLGGLGSEEIFAGYRRHVEADDINKECWRGLKKVIWKRDLTRDAAIANHVGVELRTPFLDKELIKKAMQVPGDMKQDKLKKMILREVALELGLDREFALRKKRAAQYGSGFDKVLEKFAKINGFDYKSDYLENINPDGAQ